MTSPWDLIPSKAGWSGLEMVDKAFFHAVWRVKQSTYGVEEMRWIRRVMGYRQRLMGRENYLIFRPGCNK